MTNNDPLIGRTLRNEYVIEAILGEGGMGAVYRARQKSLNRVVAIKVMHPHVAKQTGFIDRFNREAQTSALLEHSNIVPIYDYGQEDGYVYLVMRLLTGGSLADRLSSKFLADKAPPTLYEVTQVIKQIAGALDYAHRKGVIHRDMKPSNIMFDENGTPYLVDFGIAKLLSASTGLTGTGAAMGTPNFMPPEQWRGDPVTPVADQYALAVIVYHIFTSRLPFEGDTPFVLMHKHLNEPPTPIYNYRPDLPPLLMNVLMRSMAKNPNERFANCTDFARALEASASDDVGVTTNFFTKTPLPHTPPQATGKRGRTPTPSQSPPYGTPPPPYGTPLPTTQNRRGLWMGLGGGLALMLIIALLVILSGGGDAPAGQETSPTVPNVVILATDTLSPAPTDTPAPEPSDTPTTAPTDTPTPDVLTAIAYIDETNTALAPIAMTETALAQMVTPTPNLTATIDAIMADRTATQAIIDATTTQIIADMTATQVIADSIATNAALKATDQAVIGGTETSVAMAQQAFDDELATQAALDRIATFIAVDQTATATLWTPTPTFTITPFPTLTDLPIFPTAVILAPITPSPTATSQIEAPVIEFFSSDSETLMPGETALLFWSVLNADSVVIYVLNADGTTHQLWNVTSSGNLQVMIPSDATDEVGYRLTAENAGGSTSQTLRIPVVCANNWLFDPAPQGCPDTAQETAFMQQRFERGWMVYVNLTNTVYFLFEDDILPNWLQQPNDYDPAIHPASDANFVPPPNLYQPIGIFGHVWRGSDMVRNRLGFATQAEVIGEGFVQHHQERLYISANDRLVFELTTAGQWQAIDIISSPAIVITPEPTEEPVVVEEPEPTPTVEISDIALIGHTDTVNNVIQLRNGRILSASNDNTLRLWDDAGNRLVVLQGHADGVSGAIELSDGRILSWSVDGMLRLWDDAGNTLAVLQGHGDSVRSAMELRDGRILSWSRDNTLRLWAGDGIALATLEGHVNIIYSALEMTNGRILSWSEDSTLHLWDADGNLLSLLGSLTSVLTGHRTGVLGALELSDGRILSWSRDSSLRLWDADGGEITSLQGHNTYVLGATQLADGRILSWSADSTLRLWDEVGNPLVEMVGHTDWARGAIALADGRILSWSDDNTLRLWDADGTPITVLEGHTEVVFGAMVLSDGRILSWSDDTTLRLWDADGNLLESLEGHLNTVNDAIQLADGRLISWSWNLNLSRPQDITPRIWDIGAPPPSAEATPDKPVVTILSPQDGDEVVVNAPIFIRVQATDPVGVTSVHLSADGVTLRTVGASSPTGETEMEVLFDYTPDRTGTVQLSIIATRRTETGGVSSDPVTVRINVVAGEEPVAEEVVEETPLPTEEITDDSCRVVVLAPINFRREPNTDAVVIRILFEGEILPVVGRLPDNSWWQVRHTSLETGWVFSGNVQSLLVELRGICENVPITTPITLGNINETATALADIPENTPEPTATPTPTSTATSTPTPTATHTATPTPTATSTDTLTPTAIPTSTPTPAQTSSDTRITGIVQSNQRVNVRSGAGTGFGAITTLAPGDEVEILGANPVGDWLNIRMNDGQEGWISASLVYIPPSLDTVVTRNEQWIPIERNFEGVPMVLVPKGCFMMGSTAQDNERPVHQQCFDAPFWIDKFEVTNKQFNDFGGVAGRLGVWTGDNFPRENITWFEASDFCQLRGGRLPTEREWEYAARGPNNLTYPWGNSFLQSNVAFNQNSTGTVSVGGHPRGASWVGALDMSGNVREWTSSLLEPYPYDPDDGRERDTGRDSSAWRVVRGGAWSNTESALQTSTRLRESPIGGSGNVGFRCVRPYTP